MDAVLVEDLLQDLIGIVDASHRRDRVGAVMRTDDQGLRVEVRDAPDPVMALHLIHIARELCPERRVFDIVDGTVEPFGAVDRHACPSGPQMRVVVRPVKEVKNAVLLKCRCEKSAHSKFLL